MISLNQPENDVLIKQYGTINLYQIGRVNLSKFSEFIFDMHAYHASKKNKTIDPLELNNIKKIDNSQFKNSIYLGFKNSENELLATIKATKRTGTIIFPIESEFNVDIEKVIKDKKLEVNDIWHLGRTAIDSNALHKQNFSITSEQMILLLSVHLFEFINYSTNNLIISEMTNVFYQLLHNSGLNIQVVGELKKYLGHPGYPVIATLKDISRWLKRKEMAILE